MYTVLKRDGRIINFDIRKITNAIKLAFEAQERNYNDDVIDFLALKVTADFEPKIKVTPFPWRTSRTAWRRF